MGRSGKHKPKRLARKLATIRRRLGLSQNELIRQLNLPGVILQGSISGYELGTRVPPLTVLLEYARLAGVCTDVLIDDRQKLPPALPSTPAHKMSVED